MLLEFVKMSGAGNDFILLDNRAGDKTLSREQIARLCHRQFGVGADGAILLVPGQGKADWAWQFYNSDGSDAEMCGNGARCFARYIQKVTDWKAPTLTFATVAGVIGAQFQGELVAVDLTAPHSFRLREKVTTSQGVLEVSSANTGVPHAVVFVADADKTMVGPLGSELRWHEHFKPKGTNVNFVQILGPGYIRVRTYERGVEGETLACGTGVTASALIAAKLHGFTSPVRVAVQGGDELQVEFVANGEDFSGVRLKGPATFVFEGRVSV